jgi:tetratricopeptide (TPR) repeat protein
MNNQTKFLILTIAITILGTHIVSQEAFAKTKEELNTLFKQGNEHLQNGEYKQAITTYDEILKIKPNHIATLKMKAIAHSNMEEHTKSLLQFYKILQKNPNDLVALTGMGVGFGNLGEYKESIIYLNIAHVENPDNIIIKNYKKIIENSIKKYPYEPTEKPSNYKKQHSGSIPNWLKDTVEWWSLKKMNEQDFFKSMKYLIERSIVKIPQTDSFEPGKNIGEVRSSLSKWSQNESSDEKFFKNIQWLIQNKFIDIKKTQEDIEYEEYLFNKYLKEIIRNVDKEKRYIEFSNPSQDVIKKFLRDYAKWNFEQQVQMSSKNFPDPTYKIIDEVYLIKYKVYINDQPVGLPLDHVGTLKKSFEFWESKELEANNQKAKMEFEITKSKADANVWVTWVVRDMGQGVLGHAHLGKGVVEVALGDYNCGGNFQLYDVNSVEYVMTHELGHSIGLLHTNDKENIMYPTYMPSYAYCLLDK